MRRGTDWKTLAGRLAEALREAAPYATDWFRWGHIDGLEDRQRTIETTLAEYDEAAREEDA